MRDDAGAMRSADRFAEHLAERFAEQVFAHEPSDVGDASARLRAIHRKLARALRPVVGDNGFDAMFVASVRVTRTRHFALPTPFDATGGASLEAFWSAVRDADSRLAVELEVTLVSTFFCLVADFIGPDLALRLVHQAWPTVVWPDDAERGDRR